MALCCSFTLAVFFLLFFLSTSMSAMNTMMFNRSYWRPEKTGEKFLQSFLVANDDIIEQKRFQRESLSYRSKNGFFPKAEAAIEQVQKKSKFSP